MAQSAPRTIFGIHSFTPYNKATGEFYGEVKVLGGSEFSLSGEVIELTGGSSKYPWKVADGKISAEVNLTAREYPDAFFELLMGKKLTKTVISGAETSNLKNVKGTSAFSATTGVASITVSTAAAVRTGKYLIKATGEKTATIHISSDVDGIAILDDAMKVADIDLTAGDAVVAGLGLTFVAGSAVAFVTGDTATFEAVSNDSTVSASAVFGGTADVYPEFGAIVYAQKQGSNELVELDIFSLKAIGMPINMSEGAFSEYSVTMKASYEASKNGVFSMRALS